MRPVKYVLTVMLIISAVLLASCSSEKQSETESTQSTQQSTSTQTVTQSTAANQEESSQKQGGIKTYEVPTGRESTINVNNLLNSFKFDDIEPYIVNEKGAANLSQAEKEKIIKTYKSLTSRLNTEFNNQGINVNINQKTGEAILDSNVLFGGDSAELSDSGKSFLRSFIKAYSSVLLDKEFDGFIAKIMVEGHTAPVGEDSYSKGLPLSQERANVVKDYCLGSECGLSDKEKSALSSIMEAKGLSDAYPVRNADGSTNPEASRRVSFKFIINV